MSPPINSKHHIQYSWHGLNRDGQRCQGKIAAQNRSAAEDLLQQQGISVFTLKRQLHLIKSAKNLNKKQIVYFTRQLANLCQANLTVSQALAIIGKNQCEPLLQQIVNTLITNLTEGKSFYEALNKFPNIFDTTYLSLIKAGEASGTLPQILNQLADYQERALNLNGKIKKALYYPVAIAVVATLITIGLLVFIVPQFESVFANFGAELPPFSRAVIHLSSLFRQYGFYLLPAIGAIFIYYRLSLRHNPIFNSHKDQLLLKLPVIREWIKAAALARWSRLMAATVGAGVPLLIALQQASGVIQNSVFQVAMQTVIRQVQAGDPLHQTLEAQAFFPYRFTQLIAAGENSGTLAAMLEKAAALEQQSFDQTIEQITQLLEPVTMLLLSLITGSIIIAMYLPVFKMGSIL